MVSSVTVNPLGAGVATIEFVGRRTFSPSTHGMIGDGYIDVYRVTATPNAGWRFVSTEWSGTETTTYTPPSTEKVEPFKSGTIDNPTNTDGFDWYGMVCDWYDDMKGLCAAVTGVTTSVIVTFERIEPVDTFKVSTSVVPVKAGTASGAGNYASGSTCTITAVAKCSPWIFDHWTVDGVVVSNDAKYAFVVTKDVVCVAYFTHSDTGLILCQSEDGKILCGVTGEILYDGITVRPVATLT